MASTHLRMTISSGSDETRLRHSVMCMLPRFGQTEPTLDGLLRCAQALDRWVKQHAPDRKDWVVMPFEYLNHFDDCEICRGGDE